MGLAKVRADIAIELDGTTVTLTVEGNASKLTGLQELGGYLGRKVDEQVGKMLGFDAEKARADKLQQKLTATEARLSALRQQLTREAEAAELASLTTKGEANAKR